MLWGMALLIVLVLAVLGVIPSWPHSREWGYAPGGAVGLLALLQDQAGSGDAEIGVMLLPAAQGRGFAREVVGALVALVFSACPGIDRVWARHRVDHAAAAALMRAVGFPVESACGKRATCSRTRPLDSPVCMARPGGS